MTFLIVIKTIHCWETIRRQCSGLCRDAVSWKKILLHAEGDANGRQAVEILCSYYNDYGYGAMLDNGAFAWNGANWNACLVLKTILI